MGRGVVWHFFEQQLRQARNFGSGQSGWVSVWSGVWLGVWVTV